MGEYALYIIPGYLALCATLFWHLYVAVRRKQKIIQQLVEHLQNENQND